MIPMIIALVVLSAILIAVTYLFAKRLYLEWKVEIYMQGYHDGRALRTTQAREANFFEFVKKFKMKENNDGE